MTQTRWNMKRIALAGALLGAIGVIVFAQDEKKADRGKSEVEMPVKRAVADVGKMMAEMPIKDVIAPIPLKEGKVAAGLVAWHASPDAAMDAAKRSGKPVLLFQLLGRLDDEWC